MATKRQKKVAAATPSQSLLKFFKPKPISISPAAAPPNSGCDDEEEDAFDSVHCMRPRRTFRELCLLRSLGLASDTLFRLCALPGPTIKGISAMLGPADSNAVAGCARWCRNSVSRFGGGAVQLNFAAIVAARGDVVKALWRLRQPSWQLRLEAWSSVTVRNGSLVRDKEAKDDDDGSNELIVAHKLPSLTFSSATTLHLDDGAALGYHPRDYSDGGGGGVSACYGAAARRALQQRKRSKHRACAQRAAALRSYWLQAKRFPRLTSLVVTGGSAPLALAAQHWGATLVRLELRWCNALSDDLPCSCSARGVMRSGSGRSDAGWKLLAGMPLGSIGGKASGEASGPSCASGEGSCANGGGGGGLGELARCAAALVVLEALGLEYAFCPAATARVTACCGRNSGDDFGDRFLRALAAGLPRLRLLNVAGCLDSSEASAALARLRPSYSPRHGSLRGSPEARPEVDTEACPEARSKILTAIPSGSSLQRASGRGDAARPNDDGGGGGGGGGVGNEENHQVLPKGPLPSLEVVLVDVTCGAAGVGGGVGAGAAGSRVASSSPAPQRLMPLVPGAAAVQVLALGPALRQRIFLAGRDWRGAAATTGASS